MSTIVAASIYFGVGMLALGLLDLLTGRIRNRLTIAAAEAREKLAATGLLVGVKEAVLLTLGASWLFWPLVIFSALFGNSNGKKK